MGILETVSAVGGVLGEWVTHCRWRRRLCGVTRKFEWKWLTVIAVITVTALGCETLIESPLNHNQIITSLLFLSLCASFIIVLALGSLYEKIYNPSG